MPNFDFIQDRSKYPLATEINFDFGSGAYKLLEGQSNIISAIWADPTTSRTSGKLYVASYGDGAAFSVVDLKIKLLYDRYTTSIKGRANKALLQNDPKDIVI